MRQLQIVLLSLFLLSASIHAQDFSGGLITGFTTSQVNGDGVGGFYKFGISFGGYVERSIHELLDGQIELRFTQKGAANQTGTFKISLGYIEVPCIIKYRLYDNVTIFGGGGFGVPLYASYYDMGITVKTPDFDPLDILFYTGGIVRLTETIVLDLRTSYTLIPINRRFINWCLYASLHFYLQQ